MWFCAYGANSFHVNQLKCKAWVLTFTFRYQTNTTKETLETILNIQPKDSGGGSGETREGIVMRQAQDMLSRLPEDYVPHEVK